MDPITMSTVECSPQSTKAKQMMGCEAPQRKVCLFYKRGTNTRLQSRDSRWSARCDVAEEDSRASRSPEIGPLSLIEPPPALLDSELAEADAPSGPTIPVALHARSVDSGSQALDTVREETRGRNTK